MVCSVCGDEYGYWNGSLCHKCYDDELCNQDEEDIDGDDDNEQFVYVYVSGKKSCPKGYIHLRTFTQFVEFMRSKPLISTIHIANRLAAVKTGEDVIRYICDGVKRGEIDYFPECMYIEDTMLEFADRIIPLNVDVQFVSEV